LGQTVFKIPHPPLFPQFSSRSSGVVGIWTLAKVMLR
jgi:hypothetical protein